MTTRPTPGPWKIHNNIRKQGDIGIVADFAPCIIAIMGNAKQWPVEAKANAQLIAAAPELLEACKSVAASGHLESCTDKLRDSVLSAIAKAEGSL